MSEKFNLVIDPMNANYMDDENYVRYFLDYTMGYLNDLLKIRGYLFKEHIYNNLGFDFPYRELTNDLYPYDKYRVIIINMKEVIKVEADQTKAYLIEIELKGEGNEEKRNRI